ncbi:MULTISPECIES: hybrid sensor histidine kinase/response regulator [Aphanothece]|uniref:hybrid sensor histidine kinase/response regulator n=1 Tax=Aphanothece TaxID=1121 RepID=UPI0039847E9D
MNRADPLECGARASQDDTVLLSTQRIRREALLTGLAIFAISATALAVTYTAAQRSLISQVRTHLRDLAGLAATTLETEAEESALAPGLLGSASYRRATEPLLRLRRRVPDLYYAYTLVPSDTGFRFGVDSSAFIRNPGDDTPIALPGELYDDAPPGVEKAWRSRKVVVSATPYTDKWGTFISSFAPLQDRNGRVVGLLGLDLSIASLDGYLRPLRVTMGLALLASGALASVVGFSTWRSLRARSTAFANIAAAERKAREAATASELANRAKSSFLASMSHELRTPLNGVIGLSDILLGTALTDRQRECVETVKGSGESLLRLVSDVLDMAHLDSGALELESRPFDLTGLLRQEVDRLRPMAAAKGLTLTLAASADLPVSVIGDPLRLAQILRHLLANAIKFSAHGAVRINATPAESDQPEATALLLAVEDSGPGMAPEALEQLFQPFGQLNGDGATTTRTQQGAGLGLALCRGLAEALGGVLRVRSTPAAGTTFTLELPLRPSDPAPQRHPDQPSTALEPGRTARPLAVGHPLRILIAEDNSVNARVCTLMLERLGYTASLACDGEQAVLLQGRLDPDVILMDLRMPHLDGLEATRRIRASGAASPEQPSRRRRPWIIAMTANTQSSDREAAMASGMDDFLTKPMVLDDLATALSHAHGALAMPEALAVPEALEKPGSVPESGSGAAEGGGAAHGV